jgi:hypothetical protein
VCRAPEHSGIVHASVERMGTPGKRRGIGECVDGAGRFLVSYVYIAPGRRFR